MTATVTLNLTLNREPIRVATDGGTLVLSGVVTARSFEKRGAGTVVLANANDIRDLVGAANCGLIRATHADALGPTVAGRVELSEGCTLRIEANTTLDKPIVCQRTWGTGHHRGSCHH